MTVPMCLVVCCREEEKGSMKEVLRDWNLLQIKIMFAYLPVNIQRKTHTHTHIHTHTHTHTHTHSENTGTS